MPHQEAGQHRGEDPSVTREGRFWREEFAAAGIGWGRASCDFFLLGGAPRCFVSGTNAVLWCMRKDLTKRPANLTLEVVFLSLATRVYRFTLPYGKRGRGVARVAWFRRCFRLVRLGFYVISVRSNFTWC